MDTKHEKDKFPYRGYFILGIIMGIEVLSQLIHRYLISTPDEVVIGVGGLLGVGMGTLINALFGPIAGLIVMMSIGLFSYSFPIWLLKGYMNLKKRSLKI